jgi:hypothetical protein
MLESLINSITSPIRQLYLLVCRFTPGSDSLARLSLPWKWALATLFFLVMIFCFGAIGLIYFPDRYPWKWPQWIGFGSPALIVIPFLVYQFVRVWLAKERSPFPDIERIWLDALDLLAQKSIFIEDTPVYLVLGGANDKFASRLLSVGGLAPSVEVPSSGDAPISVHFLEVQPKVDGIIVFLNSCSQVSRLSRAASSLRHQQASVDWEPIAPSVERRSETLDASFLDSKNFRAGGNFEGSKTVTSVRDTADSGFGQIDDNGTILISDDEFSPEQFSKKQYAGQLSSNDEIDCEERLRYFCQLLREARGNDFPCHGLLSLLPVGLVETSANALQIAAKNDLSILRDELSMRAPNVVLVTGLEEDEGFLELMKRSQPKETGEHRFGKGADIWFLPESERLRAIGIHAAGQFEDWIYRFFKSESSLKRKHNSKLFQLLCRVRGGLSEQLSTLLANGFGFRPDLEPELASEQFLFSGCYFAATGNGESEQAFVKAVLRKLMSYYTDLEWTPKALKQDRTYQLLANMAALVGMLAVVAIVVMVFIHFRPGDTLGK